MRTALAIGLLAVGIFDPGNPYGKNRFLHGAHAVGWPATAAQRRTDDLRVDRFRRALPKSCWPIPPRWSP